MSIAKLKWNSKRYLVHSKEYNKGRIGNAKTDGTENKQQNGRPVSNHNHKLNVNGLNILIKRQCQARGEHKTQSHILSAGDTLNIKVKAT